MKTFTRTTCPRDCYDGCGIVVEKIDVQTMVEQKVLGFSLERIEEIIRNATHRELRIIVRLGYVLGAVVGSVAYVISLLI